MDAALIALSAQDFCLRNFRKSRRYNWDPQDIKQLDLLSFLWHIFCKQTFLTFYVSKSRSRAIIGHINSQNSRWMHFLLEKLTKPAAL